ncbi:MAG: putative sulfate exporter family transporter [Kangiella sp.]|jgi:uncharacterized integral membrane protein (TIGR00698 family)|nr:putative sulfate exporter family transporter [Kangiella sp.]
MNFKAKGCKLLSLIFQLIINVQPVKIFPFTPANIVLLVLSMACVFSLLPASYALAAGLIWGWFFADRQSFPLASWASLLLKIAIVLLGFSLPLTELWGTAKDSFVLTVSVIAGALILGLLIAKLFKLDKQQGWLISSGTAICGGSAIAAVGTSIKASSHNMVISLAIVFILNAVALFVFPAVGHWLDLTQSQFGLWAALGIHDTSSVVGAAAVYGEEALDVATTTKLSRALWIIPLAIIASMSQHSGKIRFSLPLFIVFFLLASSVSSFLMSPELMAQVGTYIKPASKNLFALSLLWMGTSLNKAAIKAIPFRSMLLGIILWLAVSISSLYVVMQWYP